MAVEVTVKTLDPVPTAVVAAAATWAEFPKMWGPMLDKVWGFLRGGAPAGLYAQGHNIMLFTDDVPNVEVGVQVSGSLAPAGPVVASTLPAGSRRRNPGRAAAGTRYPAACGSLGRSPGRAAAETLTDVRRIGSA